MADRSTATTTTLRVWPRGGKSVSARSISRLIERINGQEGSFRSITEDSLRESIRQAQAEAQVKPSTEGEDQLEQGGKPRADNMAEAKREIIELATQAWTESSHTLDLISLVASQFNPKGAQYTMTPFIKQILPSGCLGTEVLEVPAEKESVQLANNLTSFGWKLECLSATADSLLAAATRLESEMEKEARYWEDVLAVKNKGWSICTMPRERHSLGVRYGFLESSPEFRDRGLAALRRGDDGSVDLDLGGTFSTPRPLQVQVKRAGRVLACTSKAVTGSDQLESSILQARNNLFDEELYHEISREARALTNRGVKCMGDAIVIPLEDEVSLEISIVDADEINGTAVSKADASSAYQDIPDLAATAFRLLLSHTHRQHYKQRTQLQPPLKKRKQQRPIAAIIQPVLSHIEHRACLKQLEAYVGSLITVLRKAQVPMAMLPVDSNIHLKGLIKAQKADFANAFVEQLCSTLQSTITINFGPQGAKLDITVRSHASGTEYLAHKTNAEPLSALGQTPDEMHFSYLSVLQAYLSHLVVLQLVDLAAAQNDQWHATDPDEGELTTEPTVHGEVETLRIRLQHGALELVWCSSHLPDLPQSSARWCDGEIKEEEDLAGSGSFVEEVDRLSALKLVAAAAQI